MQTPWLTAKEFSISTKFYQKYPFLGIAGAPVNI